MALTVLGCDKGQQVTSPPTPAALTSQPGPGLQQLVTDLEARRASVAVLHQSDPSGLSVRPWLLDVNEERRRVLVFEYSSTAQLEADAAKVSPDGFRIGLGAVDWIGSPHFYKNSRIIVNYVGCTHDVTMLLEATVGRQFAGGGVPPVIANPCSS